MSYFYFPIGEMTITLDYVTSLLHLPSRGRLLDHSRIKLMKPKRWWSFIWELTQWMPWFMWEHQRCTWKIFFLGEDLWRKLGVGRECRRRRFTGYLPQRVCFEVFPPIGTSILWTKVKPMSMWHTLSISSTCRPFTSGIRGPSVWYTCTPSWAKVLFRR